MCVELGEREGMGMVMGGKGCRGTDFSAWIDFSILRLRYIAITRGFVTFSYVVAGLPYLSRVVRVMVRTLSP